MRLFVFGPGYSGMAAIQRLKARCSWIGATARTPEAAEALRQAGIEPFRFDGTAPGPGIAEAVRSASHLLHSIAPGEDGDPVMKRHGADIALTRRLSIVYLSTVGVYGDHGGALVDERTRLRPRSARSIQRVAAEEGWTRLSAETGSPVAILRLSGIYGPGRNGLVNLAEGTAKRLVKPGQVFNRIHVDDIAQAIERAFTSYAGGVFNITDDEPAPPQDVVAYAAGLMGVEPPPEQDFETADLSPMARSFYSENKRVSNAKSKRELRMDYAFPDYRVALEAMWRDGSWRNGRPRSRIAG